MANAVKEPAMQEKKPKKKLLTTDMTQGSPLRHIIWFSIPLIIGNVFQVLYNMVDAIIVGRTISVEALAAVGATGAISFLIIGFTNGLTNGFSIMVAQRFGANDHAGVRRSVAMGLTLCLIFSIVVTLIAVLTTRPLLMVMDTPADIMEDAYSYIIVIYYGIIATIYYNYLASIIRALGDSKTPLYFLLLASVLNIILDLVFILVFHMGVAGAGWATIIAQGISAILCALLIIKKMPLLKPKRRDWKWNGRFAWYHLRLGIPMAFQFSVTAVGVMVVQSVLNSFGSVAVAGYTAANKIEQLITQPFISLGVTMATYTGQNYGAGKLDRIKEGVRKCNIVVTCVAAAGIALLLLFGGFFTQLFVGSGNPEVVSFSRMYLNICAVFYLVLAYLFVYRNALQGMDKAFIALFGGVLELLARIVFALILGRTLGYAGVCITGPSAWVAATILFVVAYYYHIRKMDRGLEQQQAKV